MIDKRRCLRFKLELPVWFKVTQKQRELSMALTLNVSATGMCLSTREPLEPGQQILMQVKLPPDERVIIRTRVVWVREMMATVLREYQVGLRLVEPMQFEESKFVKFFAQKMLEYYHQNKNPS